MADPNEHDDRDGTPGPGESETKAPEPPQDGPDDDAQDDDAQDDGKGPVTRAEFNEFKRDQNAFWADVREQLGGLAKPAEPEPDPEPESLAPEPKSKTPEPEPEPGPEGEKEGKAGTSGERSYGSRRWFAGR